MPVIGTIVFAVEFTILTSLAVQTCVVARPLYIFMSYAPAPAANGFAPELDIYDILMDRNV